MRRCAYGHYVEHKNSVPPPNGLDHQPGGNHRRGVTTTTEVLPRKNLQPRERESEVESFAGPRES